MVISFYSYKGGVGRSQLLVNVAGCLCYEFNKKILLIDWDLEAPGLPFFFKQNTNAKEGLIDLLTRYNDFIANSEEGDLPFFDEKYIQSVHYVDDNLLKNPRYCIDLISAGNEKHYSNKLYSFDWDLFYNTYDGKKYIEWLKEDLLNRYDYILIDSRTGISDYSGIANIQLPDLNVFVVAPTEQNFTGASQVAKFIEESDYVQKGFRKPLILPILSRVDPFLQEKVNLWSNDFKKRFNPFFKNLFKYINKPFKDLDKFINDSFLEYNSELSFGENLLFPIKEKEGPIVTFVDKVKTISELLERIKEQVYLKPSVKEDPSRNVVYRSIISGGSVQIGTINYNVERDFQHSILFMRIDSKVSGEYSLQLILKSRDEDDPTLMTEGLPLLKEKVLLPISADLFKQVSAFQELRRLDDATFRGLALITPSSVQAEETNLSQALFDAFFRSDILEVCRDFVELLEKRKIEELVLAISTDDTDVLNLPFEMVIPHFFPEKLGVGRKSLGVAHFGLVRTMEQDLPQFDMQGKPASAAPLKMLFVTALPENISESAKLLEIEEGQKRLIDAIGTFEAPGGAPKIVIEFLDTASLAEISEALRKHHHDILHISGHGSYQKELKPGVLHLEDEDGNHCEVLGKELGETLRPHQCVKLLILSAFETAIVGNGMLEQLSEFGLPSMVAMRFSVTDTGAKIFTTALYKALSGGETLTQALASARESLWNYLQQERMRAPDRIHIAEWFTPVVYLNQYTEALVNLKEPYVLPEDFYPHSEFFKTKNTRLIGAGFIGRKRYLNQLRRSFAKSQHVVLHGLGGMGKTTLAEAFAHNYDNHSHEVIIFRNGAQISEKYILDELFARLEADEKVNKNILRQIKQYLESNASPEEKLQVLIDNYLQNRKIILIFDNFEDVQQCKGGLQDRSIGSAGLATFLQHLCRHSPKNCHLLFTTRYVVSDLKESVLHLGLDKMSYAESYRLSNFSAILREIPLAQRQNIFRRFDGHPRAYEFLEAILKKDPETNWLGLAASVGQVEAQVWESLLFEKIYQRLPPDAQHLLQMASVCSTRTPIAALAAISAQEVSALLPLLESLHEWSLCFWDAPNQQFEVHRLTREWMIKNVIPTEDLKQWAFAAGDFFKEQPTWDNAELAREYFELAEAWDAFAQVSFRLQSHYQLIGFSQKAFEFNEAILAKDIDNNTNARAYNESGLILQRYGLLDQALALYEQSLKITQQIGGRKDERAVLNNISLVYHTKGDYDTALRYLEQSLVIAQQIGDRSGEGTTLNNISQIHKVRGDYDTALQYLEQGLSIAQQIGDRKDEGAILNNISQIYDAKGDYDTALRYLEQSLAIAQQIGDRSGEGTTLNNIGQIYDAKGDYDTALQYLQQGLSIAQQIGDRKNEGGFFNNISQIYDTKGDYDTALRYLEQSLAIQQQIGDRAGEGTTLNNISQIYDTKGDYDTALHYLEQSLAIQQQIGDIAGLAVTLNNMGAIYWNQKHEVENAIQAFMQSYQINKQIGSPNVKYPEGYLNTIIQSIGEARFQEIVAKLQAE